MGGGNFKDFKAKICEISKVKFQAVAAKFGQNSKLTMGVARYMF